MSRPPVSAGLSCPPSVRACVHAHARSGETFVGGYNDVGASQSETALDIAPAQDLSSADSDLITGSVGSAANVNARSQNPGTIEGEPSEQVEPNGEPLDLRSTPAVPPTDPSAEAAQPGVAIAPALRLSPITGAEEEPLPLTNLRGTQSPDAPVDPEAPTSTEPLDLGDIPAQDAPALLSADEVELRASNTPLDLDPPIVDASLQAPAAVSADAVADADLLETDPATEVGSDEPATLPDEDIEVAAVPQRQFTGDISVDGGAGTGPRQTLAEVVSRAATMHPEVTLALARVDEAKATVERARAGFGPQIDLRVATGQEGNTIREPFLVRPDERAADAGMRIDASIRLRQMLFDFNVTRDDLLSSLATSDANRLRAIDVTEDIALRTAQAYLRILQQRQLLALIDRNISEHLKLLEIVRLNEADGNSTMADVNRVSARLSEVRSARTDLAAELDAAEDAFERLARTEPGRLVPPQPVIQTLAANAEQAVERAISRNPSLLSLAFNLRSLQHQLDVVNGDGRARVDLEVEANTRNTISDGSRSENDVRGMLVFSYRLFDAGNNEGEQRQVEARIRQARARYTDRRDQIESEVRQAYRAISSARRKLGDLREGLASSREVQAVYTEQFQAGERTIFELLDAQNALFSSERDLIVSQFSELEAAYSVLRSTGALTSTILNAS